MRVQNVKNTIVERFLELVTEYPCYGCGANGQILCQYCEYDIIREPLGQCLFCDKPSRDAQCPIHAVLDGAWIVGAREGVLYRLIDAYKFQRLKRAFNPLAELLDARLPVFSTDTVIVPIPTASSHVRQRGHDHLALLAQQFASIRKLPIETAVKRVTNTTQHFLNRRQRFEQAAQNFIIEKPLDPTLSYLIIDDIVTTGATIQEIAKLLRQAGATRVLAAVIAKQPSTDALTSVKIHR